MSRVVFLVEQLAPGLFILLGLGLLLSARRLLRARRSLRATHFELEQELARRARGDAWTSLLLLMELLLLVLGLLLVVAPTIREFSDFTPGQIVTDGQFNTPVPRFSSDAQIDASGVNLTPDDPALRVLATPTLTPTPVGTIVPNAPPASGCTEAGATLAGPGQRHARLRADLRHRDGLHGRLRLLPLRDPRAIHRRQLRAAGRSHPASAAARELGQFVPAFYMPGVYEFRLSVFDIFNAPGPGCTVNIYLSEPIPTPTPLGL